MRKLPELVGRSEGSATIGAHNRENKTFEEICKYTLIQISVFHFICIKNYFSYEFPFKIVVLRKRYISAKIVEKLLILREIQMSLEESSRNELRRFRSI